jgi:hypothetical protein
VRTRSTRLNKVFWLKPIFCRLSPAAKALLIQSLSLILCLLLSLILRALLKNPPPLYFYIVVLAAIAAFLTSVFHLDWWWRGIQFFFPLLIWTFLFIEIPHHYYLIAFLISALIFWTTFRTQVPYYPSTAALLPIILNLLPTYRSIKFIDIGSGMGGLLIKLANARSDSVFFGVEIAPLPWCISYLRAKLLRSPVNFVFGNYKKQDFGNFDVVFAYLSPVVMPFIWKKVISEMRPGSLLMSYEFIIHDVAPDLSINIADNDPILYVWRI